MVTLRRSCPTTAAVCIGASSNRVQSHLPMISTHHLAVSAVRLMSTRATTCRRPDCFSGFYWDLTRVAPDKTHTFTLSITNAKLHAGLGLGLFFDNVEPELTAEVVVSV